MSRQSHHQHAPSPALNPFNPIDVKSLAGDAAGKGNRPNAAVTGPPEGPARGSCPPPPPPHLHARNPKTGPADQSVRKPLRVCERSLKNSGETAVINLTKPAAAPNMTVRRNASPRRGLQGPEVESLNMGVADEFRVLRGYATMLNRFKKFDHAW